MSRIWTRSVRGDIFNVIAYVLECEPFEAKNWFIKKFGIKEDVSNYKKREPVNQWIKMLHTRKRASGENKEIDESVLFDYEYVRFNSFLE